jgi:hypothetical protein
VLTRIFLCAFLKKMSYELMHERKPKVSNFRAFGCKSFILKKGKLDKFQARSSDGIFLGYALEHIVCSILTLTKSWRLAR